MEAASRRTSLGVEGCSDHTQEALNAEELHSHESGACSVHASCESSHSIPHISNDEGLGQDNGEQNSAAAAVSDALPVTFFRRIRIRFMNLQKLTSRPRSPENVKVRLLTSKFA